MATAGAQGETMSDEIYDYVCTPCKRKNKVRKAERYCSECASQLCSTCLNFHNGFHDDHELFAPSDVADFQVESTAFERCEKHPKLIIERFCVSCNELLCHTCAFKHRGCGSAVVSIPHKIKELYNNAEVKKIVSQLQETVTKLRSGTAGIKCGRDSVRKCKQDAVGKVRSFFEKLATILKVTETKTIGEIETICAGIEDEMQTRTEEAEHTEAVVKDHLGKMSAGSSPTEAHMFINMKIGETLLSSAERLLQKGLSRRNLGTYHLDGRIESYLGSINTVGCFKPTYSVKNTIRYKVQMSREGTCDIQYSCLLPNGRVLLSDCNNNTLKCFSPSSNTVMDTCSMPSSPLGVCCVSSQEVAVSLGNNTIQFVTFTPSLKLSRSFKVDHDCWGIAYKDDCLFITDYGTKVYIYNLDGSLVQVITVPGVYIIRDVALSPGGELLYVAGSTGLVCLERDGRPVYTRGAGGGDCTGVCVDENGCVVVCVWGSDRVVQVGEDGEVLAELLGISDGLESPWSVCVDSINMKLYVAYDDLVVADIVAK